MKYLYILLTFLMLFKESPCAANPENLSYFYVDLNNDGEKEKIEILPHELRISRKYQDGQWGQAGTIELNMKEVDKFYQYDVINERKQSLPGYNPDSQAEFNPLSDTLRYKISKNTFSKERFLFLDINNDGLLDLIKIGEPPQDNPSLYKQEIYYQDKDCKFSKSPDKTILSRGSSWISGIYFDINKDGIPDKIDVKYEKYGILLAYTKCIIKVYFFDKEKNAYPEIPSTKIIAQGLFEKNLNFRDINNDAYPDLVITDMPIKPTSISDAINKLLGKNIPVSLNFYLYDKGTERYPPAPSFVTIINLDITKNFSISIDSDINGDGYRDLSVMQLNQAKRYIFDPQKYQFFETK